MSLEPNKIHRVKSGHSDLPENHADAPPFLNNKYDKGTEAKKRQTRVPLSSHPDLPACRIDAPVFLSAVRKKGTQTIKCQARVPLYGRSERPENGAIAPTFLSDAYKKRTQARKRQARVPLYGRSMVEMLGVLAIIGVLSVGGIAGYSKAMFKYKINQTIQIVTQAMQRLVEISDKEWGGDDNISGIQDYIDFGLLPAQLCPDDYVDTYGNTGTFCKLPLGEIALTFYQEGQRPNGEFMITFFEGDIKESCMAFLSHGWQDLYPQEWRTNPIQSVGSFIIVSSPKVGDKYLWAEHLWSAGNGAKQNNITLSDIETACGGCTGGSFCSIGMYINLP